METDRRKWLLSAVRAAVLMPVAGALAHGASVVRVGSEVLTNLGVTVPERKGPWHHALKAPLEVYGISLLLETNQGVVKLPEHPQDGLTLLKNDTMTLNFRVDVGHEGGVGRSALEEGWPAKALESGTVERA
jgi:hypothetical protein